MLKPGRYPYNPYAEAIELHDPVTIPAGYRGVVTLLARLRRPKNPNRFLVDEGERGVQKKTLDPATYYLNPYETRVSLVDCRSKRFNLGQATEMDFLSADGFPITLDGAVEFRVLPEQVADVFVKYNEDENGDRIDEEIIAKIITPESRSLCRIGGSKLSGGQFISGDDRGRFLNELVKKLTENCKKQGIEILAVAITTIQPPDEIADPRPGDSAEVAKQELAAVHAGDGLQQVSGRRSSKVQEVLADQKKKLVEAEQAVVEKTTKAELGGSKQVAVTLASQKLTVAQTHLEAAKDKASAITAQGGGRRRRRDPVQQQGRGRSHTCTGLAARVAAFDGDGSALARNTLVSKLAPAFRTILSNSEGPIMDLFSQFSRSGEPRRSKPPTESHYRRSRIEPSGTAERPASTVSTITRGAPTLP